MILDFQGILTIAAAITGLVVLLDKLFWAKKRHAGQSPQTVIEYSRSFFPVIMVVLVLRAFVIEPFRIPSGSMLPALHVGDFIAVSKFSYGLRLPITNTKIVEWQSPKRGDVAVFRYPANPGQNFIKRIVGLPGDHIRYQNKHLFVNGQSVPVTDKGVYLVDERPMDWGQEVLDGVTHDILENPGLFDEAMQGEWVVPQGEYFVLGDNRDNSHDSRVWGTVPEQNLVGRALCIWMNWSLDKSGFPIDWSRIGRLVR